MGKKKKTKTRDATEDLKEGTELYTQTLNSLKDLYADGKGAWTDADEETFEGIDTVVKGITASVYGEITMQGVSKVIAKFREAFNKPNAVFYDLGCGLGRMVGQVALLTNVTRSIGVELCPNRYAAAKKLADSAFFPAAKPEFIEGNFLDQDYSDATIVYIDNTMYNKDVLQRLLGLLPDECIIIYQAGWLHDNAIAFPIETTYNSKLDPKDATEEHDRLFIYISTHAAWRPVKGFEF